MTIECKTLPLETVIGFSGKRKKYILKRITERETDFDFLSHLILLIFVKGNVPNGLQYTPCGKYILYPLGSIVIMKDTKSGRLIFFDAGIDNIVSCMALSKDGRFMATGHEAKGFTKVESIVWDLKSAIKDIEKEYACKKNSYLIHRLFQHTGKVQSLDFSFDAKFLVTIGGQDDNDLVVWDVDLGKGICGCPAASDTALCIRWLNKRNDRFVTCGNYHFRVWQVCTSIPTLHAVDANMGSIRRSMTCICIANDDNFAFVGSRTGEVLQFTIDRDEIKNLDEPDNIIPALQRYNKVRFSKGVKALCCIVNQQTGNTNVIAGAGDGTIQLLNPKLQFYESYCAKVDGGITSISLDTTGRTFIVGTDLCQRFNVDLSTFTLELRGTGHHAEIYDVKFPRESSEIFVTSSADDIRVWNAKKKIELLRIRVPNKVCKAIDISPTGTYILSAWSDGKIRSFYPETGKVHFEIHEAHPDEVTALAICEHESPSENWYLISGDKNGGLRVWLINKSYQRLVHAMKEHRGSINALVCNTNGIMASASSDGSCIIWDAIKGVRIHALFEQSVFMAMKFHPDDSQYLTCGSNCKISYWDASDASAIRVIDGGDLGMNCLDIISSGERFASGSADKSVKLWAYDDGVTLAKGCCHSGVVNKVTISPDEKKIVSVGSEGGIFIWDLVDSV
jgi:WD40 repeat protein